MTWQEASGLGRNSSVRDLSYNRKRNAFRSAGRSTVSIAIGLWPNFAYRAALDQCHSSARFTKPEVTGFW